MYDDDQDGLDDLGPWDFCPEDHNPASQNADWDWSGDACDCAPRDGDTYPGAPEVNDGKDNQCPGDGGYGTVDETTGNSGFRNPDDKTEYSWPAQHAAVSYEVARPNRPDFSANCLMDTTPDTWWHDPEVPSPTTGFYYLNHPLTPHVGSWVQDSSGRERIVCP